MGEGREQGEAFGVTVIAETGGYGVEVGVVVAGMAAKLPCAFGEIRKKSVERCGVEIACGRDADGASCRAEQPRSYLRKSEKAWAKVLDEAKLKVARETASTETE